MAPFLGKWIIYWPISVCVLAKWERIVDIFLLLPWPVVRQINMRRNEKCGEKLLLLIYINIQRPNKLSLIIFRPRESLLNAKQTFVNVFVIGKYCEILFLYVYIDRDGEVSIFNLRIIRHHRLLKVQFNKATSYLQFPSSEHSSTISRKIEIESQYQRIRL